MEHYVTLFDSAYLPQGLALHRSMKRWCGDFTLWVICMDDEVHHRLSDLGESTIIPIVRADWESPDLLNVKGERNKGEYCWTVTPSAPSVVFALNSSVSRVTYLDADIWFRASPQPIFDEFEQSGKAVLISEHAYSPDSDASATSGKYCVQFMTFARTRSDPVVNWWGAKCIEWCFDRYEGEKYGDQKYLDDWTTRFADLVHVLQRKSLIQGPWNSKRFPYSEAVAFHFHGLRLLRGNRAYLGYYPLSMPLISNVYEPYLADLARSINECPPAVPYRGVRWQERFWQFRWLKMRLRRMWKTRRLRRLPHPAGSSSSLGEGN